MERRVRLEIKPRKKSLLERGDCFSEERLVDQIAFPKFEREVLEFGVKRDRPENEPAIGQQQIVIIKRAAAFKREIGGVNKIFVELISTRVYVVDPVVRLSIDSEHQVW